MARSINLCWFMSYSVVCWVIRDLIETWLENWWQEIQGIGPSGWAKNVKIFVSHVNAHQMVTSALEDFTNQMDRMTCSVDTSQHLSQFTPIIAHWFMHKVAKWQGWRLLHGLSNMDFHSSKPSWLDPLLRTQSACSRDQPWDRYHSLGGISQPPRGRWVTLGYFHHGRDGALFFLESILPLDIELFFLHIMLLLKLYLWASRMP